MKPNEKFKFAEAIEAAADGERLTRAEWKNEEVYIFIHNNLLSIHIDNEVKNLIVSIGDIQGEDWYIIL